MKADTPSELIGALSEALMLRYLHMARQQAHTMEWHDLVKPGVLVSVPGYADLARRYLDLIHTRLGERPKDSREALALVQFAVSVMADRPITQVQREGSIASDDNDRSHAMMALAAVADWLNERTLAEYALSVR